MAPLTPPQLILVAYSFCLLLPPAVNKEVLVTTVSLAPKTVPSTERALKKHRRLHECPVRWLEREQQRATHWRRTKALASSPYDSLFLRQPWTHDSSTIPACQSEQPGHEAATTCPRTHSRRKPGHDSTWGGGLDHTGVLELSSLASKLQHTLFPHCRLPLAFFAWRIHVHPPGPLLTTPPSRPEPPCHASLGTPGSSPPVANHSASASPIPALTTSRRPLV